MPSTPTSIISSKNRRTLFGSAPSNSVVFVVTRCGVTIIALNHLRKTPGSAVHRSIDSIAFIAASRAAWAFAPDPEDEDRHFMVVAKGNLMKKGHGLAYRITGPIGAPYLEWEQGTVSMNADDVLSDVAGQNQDERREAREWLQDLLADGPVAAKRIQSEAKSAGLSWATVRRAKEALSVVASKSAFWGGWEWRLEDAHSEDAYPIYAKVSTFE